jgi:hypothetical protein
MVIGLILGFMITGCSGFPKVFWPPLSSEGIEAGMVLDYYRKAGTLSSATIDKEIKRLQRAYRNAPDNETLFQLVALASQPERTPAERKLALDLLKDFRRQDTGGRALLSLVSLLEDQLSEQMRLVGNYEQARQQVQELGAANRELQDKLQALKDIEKILRQREK